MEAIRTKLLERTLSGPDFFFFFFLKEMCFRLRLSPGDPMPLGKRFSWTLHSPHIIPKTTNYSFKRYIRSLESVVK